MDVHSRIAVTLDHETNIYLYPKSELGSLFCERVVLPLKIEGSVLFKGGKHLSSEGTNWVLSPSHSFTDH